ncbi:hypothetical protein [Streptomyces sp. NPDC001083]|uniref:hypothetical protein n=1 Tax=Streptomyces sp. NPDC001083 TaxID=3364545 RepID=UPI0036A4A88E
MRDNRQAIDPTKAVTGQAIVTDPQDAAVAARAYLRSASATGSVSVSGDGKSVTVTVNGSSDTTFLSAVGIGSLPVTGHATATLLHGVTAPEGP